MEQALLDTATLRGAQLAGAWCDDASAYGTDFTGADLRGVRFQGAQLAGAILTGAHLAGVNLSGVDFARVADRAGLATRPTGDEITARAASGSARSEALRGAADSLDLLATALFPAERDARLARQMRAHANALRRESWRFFGTPGGLLRWAGQTIGAAVAGNGDDPARVALWAAGLIGFMTASTLVLGSPGIQNLGDALRLALTGFTTAGFGAFDSQTTGLLTWLGAIESVLGDLLAALFIAATVRRFR
jgi:uncharacterized protein YjbI with pentapeptide repeats